MKKVTFSAVMLFAAICVAFSSCGSQSRGASDADSLVFDSIVVDTVAMLEGDSSLKCEINMNIIYASGGNAAAVNDTIMNSGVFNPNIYKPQAKADSGITMRQAVDKFVAAYIANYREECGKMVAAGVRGASLNYQYMVRSSVAEGRPGVITYQFDTYSFSGGAHGMSFVKALNFDKATGAKIGKADFFTADADSVVTGRIVENLSGKYQAANLDELKKKGVFQFSEPFVPDNFVLGKDSVTFIYQPYEIAAYVFGSIRASVAYSDIDKVIVKK